MVFLVEEKSMAVLLEALLPRMLPKHVSFRIVPHEGKKDLLRAIPGTLRAWNVPNTKFVILIDNDGGDCRELKAEIAAHCQHAARADDTLIRIVCQELESWFLGDLPALAQSGLKGGQKAANLRGKKPFRNPDSLTNAKAALRKIIPDYFPVTGARAIAPCLDIDQNMSHSFRCFRNGIQRFAA